MSTTTVLADDHQSMRDSRYALLDQPPDLAVVAAASTGSKPSS